MEHRVPLSGQALDLLGEASALREDDGLVFPSQTFPTSSTASAVLTSLAVVG